MVTEDDVRRVCLGLPSVVEKPYERMPGFRVKDKMFARIRQAPDALLAKTSELKEFFDASYAYASSLKPKPTAKKK